MGRTGRAGPVTRVLGELCLVGAVLAPLVGAIVAVTGGGGQERRCRTAAGLGWVSTGLAIVAATSVALGGPFAVALDGAYGRPVLGLWADQLTVTLLILVCGVGAMVQSFSVRYLQADRAAPRFFAAANVVVVAMAVVSTSATAAVLVVAWVTAGMGFVAVAGYRPDLPGVRACAWRTLRMFAIGDLALVAALVMIWVRVGNVDMVSAGALRAAAGRLGDLSTVVALLVVAAALTRSAQGPLGRWLPGTVSAPTPVSALLHAGVVNGGGILLVRLGALTGDSALAMVAAFAVAGLTATVATALMTRKADVKGALAFSTMGQMGLMIAACAVGAYLAAVVHLIGHAMYKATLFFGSGSQVPHRGQTPVAPAAAMSTLARTAATGTTAAATVAVIATIPGALAHRGGVALLAFVAATAAAAGWSWWGRRPASARLTALWVTAMLGAGALYGLVLSGLGRWITPALPTAGAGTLSPWWLLALAVTGLAVASLARVPGAQRWLVAVLVDAGAPPLQLPMRNRRPAWCGARAGLPDFVPEGGTLVGEGCGVNSAELLAARARLLVQVEEAARVIAPLWPLSTFIAVNPLWDLRQMPFDEAVAHASVVLGIYGYPPAALFAEAYASRRITVVDLRTALDDRCAVVAGARRRGKHEDGAGASRTLTTTERYDLAFGTGIAAAVDREVAKWCAAYLAGMMPAEPDGGFYAVWRAIVAWDPAARRIAGRAGRDRLAQLGAQPEDAILACLERLDIADGDRVSELARQLARMPGWAGHAKWRSRWAAPHHPGPVLHLVDYLAVRLGYEAELLGTALAREPKRRRSGRAPFPGRSGGKDIGSKGPEAPPAHFDVAGLPDDLREQLSRLPASKAASVWLAAYEGHYRDWLLATLDQPTACPVARPVAQAVFCMDVRSEGLRRHLEVAGPYETFGFAGFFGLPIRYQPWGSAEAVDLCPVLLHPSTEMMERPSTEADPAASRQLTGRQAQAAVHSAFDTARKAAVSPFILAEAGGFLAGPIAAVKTLSPSRYQTLGGWARRFLAPPVATVIDAASGNGTMNDEEQALFAETALTTMGLTGNFAPVVLLCGHGSTTENNPHASSLDCGACGGNRGGASARAGAAILNRDATRHLLAARGILIPDGTVFVAGEHDTATDQVTVFDAHLFPPVHRDSIATLQADLDRAGAALATERAPRLPGTQGQDPVTHVAARSADWAQVQPEWGLARNAAFIVAPRSVTAGVDLACRCFLHSYDPGVDPDGAALETILTAPMVVAHWINAQYYFSTVDPEVLSAGDKTVHNIVAGIAVVQGAGGDLQVGLPLQSLFDGVHTYHEPMRLLTVVQAPQMLLETVIARNPVLRELFDGQWVHLAARDDERDSWKIRRPDGTWALWTLAGTRTKEATTHG